MCFWHPSTFIHLLFFMPVSKWHSSDRKTLNPNKQKMWLFFSSITALIKKNALLWWKNWTFVFLRSFSLLSSILGSCRALHKFDDDYSWPSFPPSGFCQCVFAVHGDCSSYLHPSRWWWWWWWGSRIAPALATQSLCLSSYLTIITKFQPFFSLAKLKN